MNNFSIPIYQANQNYNIVQAQPIAPFQGVVAQTYAPYPNFSYPSNYYINNGIKNTDNVIIPPEIKLQDENAGWKLIEVEQTPFKDNIYKYQLKNGQIVALMPKANTSTVIKTFVNAGSMNENDKNRGISHFNEHNVFNGSKKIAPGTFFTEAGKMGADVNASTSFAQTDFYIESPMTDAKSFKNMIEMHADMLTNPLFPEEMVEKEKGPVTSEISMCNDNPSNIALNSLIKNLFQINSTSEDLIAGSLETVSNITRDDVYNHWKKHFTPDNMYTVLTGDFDPNEAIDIISKNFTTPADLNAKNERTQEKLTPTDHSTRNDFISPKDSSTTVLCGFCGTTPDNKKDAAALEALSLLLMGNDFSRLSKNLNSIYSQGNFMTEKVGLDKNDPNALIYQFSAQKGDESKVMNMFYDAVKYMESNPPTEEEMTAVKSKLLKLTSLNYENSHSINDIIGTSLLSGDFSNISEDKKIIENLTAQDIVNAANKYLDFDKMAVSVVHPKGTTEKEIQQNYNKNLTTANLSFTGNRVSANDVQEYTLSDNSRLAKMNSTSDNCYFNWRLISKDNIPNNPACAYVLTQMLNDGTQTKSKEVFALEKENKSASINIDTNGFQIAVDGNCLYGNLQDTINLTKEALFNPRFTQEDFDKAVKKIETYCKQMDKDASTNLLAKLYGKYFPSPKQIMEGLKSLTLNDVREHYNNLIFNSASNISISAPVQQHPELEGIITNGFATSGHLYKPYKPELLNSFVPNEKTTVLLDSEERNQAQIYKNYSFKISGNIEDEVKFELLNTILGGGPNSRLFQDLREKEKLAYTTSSTIQSFENSGILTMKILTTTDDKKQNDIKYDNLQKSVDGFEKHTNKLMQELVTDEELEAAKMTLKQDITAQLQSAVSKTDLIAMNLTQPYGIKRIDEYIAAIDKITKEDIKEAANHIFSNKPVYSILASKDTINNQSQYISNLGEVVNV